MTPADLASALDSLARSIPSQMGSPDDQRSTRPWVDLAIEVEAASALLRAAERDDALAAEATLFAAGVLARAGHEVTLDEAALREDVARRILSP